MVIALATVRSNVFTILFDHLQTDGTFAITSNNIHPNFNSNQLITEGYPQIIIKNPTVSMTRIARSPTSPLRRIPIDVDIEIHHNSAASAKSVTDEVWNSIITGENALRVDGLFSIEFDEDVEEDTQFQENATVHVYTLNLTAIFMVKG